MRKKDLLAQNIALFESLQKAEVENKRLNSQIIRLSAIIDNLQSKAEENATIYSDNSSAFKLNGELLVAEDATVDDVDIALTQLDGIVDYGAEIIGRLVVEAAKYSNQLTADGNTKYMELVNLLLGKTEVAKADILSITSALISDNDKKNAINTVFDDTLEYFQSVMAQKN